MKKGVIAIFYMFMGFVGGVIGTKRIMDKKRDVILQFSDKHLALFLMMNQWVKVKQEGKNLVSYFEKNGYKRIAVYGMSYAGEAFIRELQDTEIEVAYGIDKNANNIFSNIDIISADDSLKDVDLIVVTAITFYDEIKEELCKKIDCPIVCLEDILYDV
ncbi:MAG: hypothetical protein HFG52_13805 [Lachnospiraceae bacterium]|nr:hypothetical protein [Lachnospiraceae bacterium]